MTSISTTIGGSMEDWNPTCAIHSLNVAYGITIARSIVIDRSAPASVAPWGARDLVVHVMAIFVAV